MIFLTVRWCEKLFFKLRIKYFVTLPFYVFYNYIFCDLHLLLLILIVIYLLLYILIFCSDPQKLKSKVKMD